MVKAPALSMVPMIAFRDALCITHNPVNGTVSQGREGPARVAGCRIILRTPGASERAGAGSMPASCDTCPRRGMIRFGTGQFRLLLIRCPEPASSYQGLIS